MLTSLVARFVGEAPKYVEVMRAAVKELDAVALVEQARALVGVAASVGAVRVLYWAKQLGEPKRLGTDAATLLRKLDIEVTTAVATLEPLRLAA